MTPDREGRAGARRGALLAAALLAAALLGAGAARAQDGEPWSYDVWSEFMSPYCPGRTLSDCPSAAAESVRLWVLEQERAGRSRDEVEAELLARYGDEVRSAPRAEGLGLAAYLIPIAAFLAGGAFVAWFLRRQTRRPGAAAPPATPGPGAAPAPPAVPADAELERLLDEELSR